MYIYYDFRNLLIVIVFGNCVYMYLFRRQVYLFIDILYYLDEFKFFNMVLLGESQVLNFLKNL